MNDWLDRNRLPVIIALIIAAVVSIAWSYTQVNNESSRVYIEVPTLETLTPTVILPTETPVPTNTPTPLRVYVSGAVNHPDVYFLPHGAIIKDAIAAAGGITASANIEVVNLARELQDQQHIHIPRKTEAFSTPQVVEGGVQPANTSTVSSTPRAPMKVNINTANLQELELLPSIGPAIAQRIIDYRDTNGKFNAVEDIMHVRGIGQATFEHLQSSISVK